MSVACLKNVIGIDHTDNNDKSSSGLYMSNLAGIELDIAGSVNPDSTKSGKNLIQRKLDEAQLQIMEDVKRRLRPYMQQSTVIDNRSIGEYEEDLDSVASESGKYKGILVEVDRSPYLDVYVNTISLKVDSTQDVNVLVFDLMTGKQIDTITISAQADEQTRKVINKSYKTHSQLKQLLFAYDAGVAGTYDTFLHSSLKGCRSCDPHYSNDYATFYGVEIGKNETKIRDNADSSGDGTAGLSLDYSLQCNPDQFICNMANSIAFALRYLAAHRIMLEAKVSKRLNSIVTIHHDSMDYLEQVYWSKYKENLDSVLENMKLPNDICFACAPKITNRVRVP